MVLVGSLVFRIAAPLPSVTKVRKSSTSPSVSLFNVEDLSGPHGLGQTAGRIGVE